MSLRSSGSRAAVESLSAGAVVVSAEPDSLAPGLPETALFPPLGLAAGLPSPNWPSMKICAAVLSWDFNCWLRGCEPESDVAGEPAETAATLCTLTTKAPEQGGTPLMFTPRNR